MLGVLNLAFLPVLVGIVSVIGATAIPFNGTTAGIVPAMGFGIALCIMAAVLVIRKDSGTYHFRLSAIAGLPLLLAAFLAVWGTPALVHSFFGVGFEMGTIGSIALIVAATALGAIGARFAVTFLYLFEAVAVVVGMAVIITGFTHLSAISYLAPWPQLSFMLCAAALVGAVLLDYEHSSTLRVVHAVVLVVALLGFIVLFIPAAAGVGAGIAAVVAIAWWGTSRESGFPSIPIVTVFIGCVLLTLVVAGVRAPSIRVSADTRPSMYLTELIVVQEYEDSLKSSFVGVGPNGFSYAWNMYRPKEVNATPLWDTVPASPYSTAALFAIELGFLGLLVFLSYPLTVLVAALYARRGESVQAVFFDGGVVLPLCVLGLFCFVASIVYPTDLPLLLAGAMALGFCTYADPSTETPPAKMPFMIRGLTIIVCLMLGSGLLWVAIHQLIAARAHAKAEAITVANPAIAAQEFQKAANIWPTSGYQRDAAQGLIALVFATAKAGFVTSPEERAALKTAAESAATFSRLSVKTNPQDVEALLSGAAVFINLKSLGLDGALDEAASFSSRAKTLTKTRPDIFYIAALVASLQGKTQEAESELEKALSLKPDYEDSLKFKMGSFTK